MRWLPGRYNLPQGMKPTKSLLSAEVRLILLSIAANPGSNEVSKLLQEPLDWQKLLALVDRERCALPLSRLIGAAGDDIDPAGSRVLQRMASIWEFKLFHIETLLLTTLEAFEQAGVHVVLLKGGAAAFSVYGGFQHRPMIDVDVLVPEEHADTAWSLAQSVGWHWRARDYPREAYLNAHHLPPLNDTFGSGSALEIHRALTMRGVPFRFSAADVRRRAIELTAGDCSFSVPHVNHQLLHCCIHFAWSHRMASHAWRAFSDVAAFVSAAGMDWEDFVSMAKESNADTCCYWTLRMSSVLADVPVPADVLKALRPRAPELLLQRLERHFAFNLLPDGRQCPSIALQEYFWKLAIQRGKGSGGIALPAQPPPMGIAGRVAYHTANLRDWIRYLGRML